MPNIKIILTFILVMLFSLIATKLTSQLFISKGKLVISPTITNYFGQLALSLKKTFPTPSHVTPSPQTPSPSPTTKYTDTTYLAQCLANKKFTMYGTPDCPSCLLQKSYFGDDFKYIPNIDCNQNQELCRSKGIRAYPTWEDANGTKYQGAIPLDKLAEISKCP